MKLALALLVLATFASQIYAQVDPLNTYRWNRSNAMTGRGQIDTKPWFEWWYYKVVLPETNDAFFFVYGVVNPWDSQRTLGGTRASVIMGDFTAMVQAEDNLPLDTFNASYDETLVTIKDNVATDKFVKGQITNEQGEQFAWNMVVEKDWAFNATSWATGRGVTNIEWYPAQASARCSGSIMSKGKTYQFDHAPCYQDRNWGNSFPEWWTWLVSNSFDHHPSTTLAIGGGKPKFFGRIHLIESVAIGLKHKGHEYSWRPSDLDKVKIDINFGKWEVVGINRTHKIEVSAYAPKTKFLDLNFMTPEGKIFHDYEALTGDMTVKLYKRKVPLITSWELVETLTTHHAGIEYGSEQQYPIKSLFNGQKTLYSNL